MTSESETVTFTNSRNEIEVIQVGDIVFCDGMQGDWQIKDIETNHPSWRSVTRRVVIAPYNDKASAWLVRITNDPATNVDITMCRLVVLSHMRDSARMRRDKEERARRRQQAADDGAQDDSR